LINRARPPQTQNTQPRVSGIHTEPERLHSGSAGVSAGKEAQLVVSASGRGAGKQDVDARAESAGITHERS